MIEDKDCTHFYSDASILCPGHTRTVVGLNYSALTPDGVFFVSACHDAKPMLRDAATGNWVGSFIGHDGAVWCSAINKEATRVVTGSADFTSKLWNATNGECIHTFEDKHIVKSVALNNDSSLVAVGGKAKEVSVYSTIDFSRRFFFPFEEEVAFLYFCPSPSTPELLLCVGVSGRILILNLENPENPVKTSLQLTDIINDVSLSGDIIAIASCNGVRFLSWEGSIVNKKDYPYHIKTCSLSHDHCHYLICEMDTIYEIDYTTHKCLHSYHGHHGSVLSLRYSPVDYTFISGSDDSSIRIWSDKPYVVC